MKKTINNKTKIGNHQLHPESLMMSYGYDPMLSEGAIKPPVFLTSTFCFPNSQSGEEFFNYQSGRKPLPSGTSAGLIYSRFNHPNAEIGEDRLALLEGAEESVICASGMGAITCAFLSVLRPGDVLVHSAPLYGGTQGLISNLLSEFGIKAFGFKDGLDKSTLTATLQEAQKHGPVKAIYIETPANPTNDLVDFEMIKQASLDMEKQTGLRPLTICDNTLQGPIFQRAVASGIDLAVYSLTKYVGGHSDIVAGCVMGNGQHIAKVRGIRTTMGFNLDPHTSWMITRSLETLSIRMQRAEQTGKKVAQWLATNPYVSTKVLHPNFITDPVYQAVYKRQCTGAGSTFSFVITDANMQKDTPEGAAALRAQCFKIIDTLTLFKSAVSLGGSESLVSHPASTTHSGVPQAERLANGLSEGLIRISVGLEHPDDLIADLNAGFAKVYKG